MNGNLSTTQVWLSSYVPEKTQLNVNAPSFSPEQWQKDDSLLQNKNSVQFNINAPSFDPEKKQLNVDAPSFNPEYM